MTGSLLEDKSVSNDDLDLEEEVKDDVEMELGKYHGFCSYDKKICLIGTGGLFTSDVAQ